MTKAVIVFFVSLAVYLVILLGVAIVKYILNKRKIKKQLAEDIYDEVADNEQSKK